MGGKRGLHLHLSDWASLSVQDLVFIVMEALAAHLLEVMGTHLMNAKKDDDPYEPSNFRIADSLLPIVIS